MPDITNLKNVLYKTLEYTTNIDSNKCFLFSANGNYKIGCYLSTADINFYFEVDNNGSYKITNVKCNTANKPELSIFFKDSINGREYYAQLSSGTFGTVTTRKEIFYGIMNASLTAATTETLENPVITIDFNTEEIIGSYKITNNSEVLDISVQKDVVVGGNANVSNNLSVSGNATINKDLSVIGEATFAGETHVSSSVSLNTLDVTGHTIANNVNSCTTFTLSGNTDVSGNASLNTLNVTNHTVAKDIISTSTTTYESYVNVSGNATLNTLEVSNNSKISNLNIEGELKSKKTVSSETIWVDTENNIVSLTTAEQEYLDNLGETEGLRIITEYVDAEDQTKNRRALTETNTYIPSFDVSGNTTLNKLTVSNNTNINNLNVHGTMNQTSSNKSINVSGDIDTVDITNITTANINKLNVYGTLDQTDEDKSITVTGNIEAKDITSNDVKINNFVSAGEVYVNEVDSNGIMTINNDTVIQQIIPATYSNIDSLLIKENLGKLIKIDVNPVDEIFKVIATTTTIEGSPTNITTYNKKQLAGVIETATDMSTTDLLVAKLDGKYYDVEKYNKLKADNHVSFETAVLSTEDAEKAIKKLLRNELYRLEASSLIAKDVRFADLLTVNGTTVIEDNGDYGNIYFGDTNVAVRGVTVEAYGQISIPDDYRYKIINDNTTEESNIVIEKAEYTVENNETKPILTEIINEYDKENLYTIYNNSIKDRIKTNTSVLGRTIKFADGIISLINKDVTENNTTTTIKQLNVRNSSRILLAIYEDSTSIFNKDKDLYDQYCEANLLSDKLSDLSSYTFDDVLLKFMTLEDDTDNTTNTSGKYISINKDSRKIYPSLLVYVDETSNENNEQIFNVHIQQTHTNGNAHTYIELDNDAYDFVSETWGMSQLNLGTNFLDNKQNNLYVLIPSPAIMESYSTSIVETYTDDNDIEQIREIPIHNYILQNTMSLYATSLEATDDYLVTAKALYGILNNGATSTTPFASNLLKQSANNNILYQQNPTTTKYVQTPISETVHAKTNYNNYILTQAGADAPNFTYKIVKDSTLYEENISNHHNIDGDLLSYTNKPDNKITIPTVDYINKLLELGYATYFDDSKNYNVYIDNLYTNVNDPTDSGFIIQFRNPNVSDYNTDNIPQFEEEPHARSIYKYTGFNKNTASYDNATGDIKHEIKKVLVSYYPKKYDYILPGDYIVVNEDLNYVYKDGLLQCKDPNESSVTYIPEGDSRFDIHIKYNLTILHNNSIENGKVTYVSNSKVSGKSGNISTDKESYNIPLFDYNKFYKEKNNNTSDPIEYNYELHNSDIKVKNNNGLILSGLTTIDMLSNVNTTNLNVDNIKALSSTNNINIGDINTSININSKDSIISGYNSISLKVTNDSTVAATLNANGIKINAGNNGIEINDNSAKVLLKNNKNTNPNISGTEIYNDSIDNFNISTNNININLTDSMNISSLSSSTKTDSNNNIVRNIRSINVSNIDSIAAPNTTLSVKNIDKQLKVSQLDNEYILVELTEIYDENATYRVLKNEIIGESGVIYKSGNLATTAVNIDNFDVYKNSSHLVKLKESILTDTALYTSNIYADALHIKQSAIDSMAVSSINVSAGAIGNANITNLTVTNQLRSNGVATLNNTTYVSDLINNNTTDNTSVKISNGNFKILSNTNNAQPTEVINVSSSTKNISITMDEINITGNTVTTNSDLVVNGNTNIDGNIVIDSSHNVELGNTTINNNTITTNNLGIDTITTKTDSILDIEVDSDKYLKANLKGTFNDETSEYYYDYYGELDSDENPTPIKSVDINSTTPIIYVDSISSESKKGKIKSGLLRSLSGVYYVKNNNSRVSLDNDITISTNGNVYIGNDANNRVVISGADIDARNITADTLTIKETNMLVVEQSNLSTADRLIELAKTTRTKNNTTYDVYTTTDNGEYIGFYAKQLNASHKNDLDDINSSDVTISGNLLSDQYILIKQIDPLDSSYINTKLGQLRSQIDTSAYEYWYGYDYSTINSKFLPTIAIYQVPITNRPVITKTSNGFTINIGTINNLIIDRLNENAYIVKGLFIGNDGFWKVGRAITNGDNKINANLSGSMLQDILTRTQFYDNNFQHSSDVITGVASYNNLTQKYEISNTDTNATGLLMAYNYDTKRMEGLNFNWEDALNVVNGKVATNVAGDIRDANNNHFGVTKINSITDISTVDISTNETIINSINNGLTISGGVIGISVATKNQHGTMQLSSTNANGLTITDTGILGMQKATSVGSSNSHYGTVKVQEGNGLYIDDNSYIRMDVAKSSRTDNDGNVIAASIPGAVTICTGYGLTYDESRGIVGTNINAFVTNGNGLNVTGSAGNQQFISMSPATTSTAGAVSIDTNTITSSGVTISNNGLTISSTGALGIKLASSSNYGTVKVNIDNGLKIDDNGILDINRAGVIGSNTTYGTVCIDTNTVTSSGVTISNNGLIISSTGVLGIEIASSSNYGTIKVNSNNGLTIDSYGILSLAPASSGSMGTVKIGEGISVDNNGLISISTDGSNIVISDNKVALNSNINVSQVSASSINATTVTADQYYANSDRRLKNISKELDYSALDILDNLKTYSFTYKNDPENTKYIGVMAQDLKDINIDGFSFVNQKDDGFYEIKETKLIYLLIKAIQEQKEEIEKLKKQINLGE